MMTRDGISSPPIQAEFPKALFETLLLMSMAAPKSPPKAQNLMARGAEAPSPVPVGAPADHSFSLA